jgi:uncharacterized damage-inducible protein DinB
MNEHDHPKTARQTAFLRRLTQAKERLLLAIEDLDPAILTTERVVGEWTIKDLLGHIVVWNEEFRVSIEMILAGKHPGYDHQISEEDDFGSWNQQIIERKRNWSIEHILADLERDYQEAVDLILRLQPEDYRKRGVTPWKQAATGNTKTLAKEDTDSVETLVTFHWRHMNQHAHQIEKWRKQRK